MRRLRDPSGVLLVVGVSDQGLRIAPLPPSAGRGGTRSAFVASWRCVCVELGIGAKKNLRSFVLRRFIFAARSLRHLLYAGSVLSRAACLSGLVVAFSGQQPGSGFSGRNLCFSRKDQYASSMPNRKIEAEFFGWTGVFSLSPCGDAVCGRFSPLDLLLRFPELGL